MRVARAQSLGREDRSRQTRALGAAIQLDHGTGGGMSRELIAELIAPRLGAAHAGRMEDSAVLELGAACIAVTTDSFVIDPIFFGNGDIGKLAVCGTVNDLAVSGAVPRYLTLSLVLEEGFPIADLERVLDSVRDAALAAGVEVVAGDTKVVRAGEVDKLFVNTAGVGLFEREPRLGVGRVGPGDAVIVTGWLGNHSIHILSLREGLGFEERVLSDCAPLNGLVWNVLEEYADHVHCMRDITRGGLGTVLNELAAGAGVSIQLEEGRLPIQHETAMAADMLGVNPLYLANEGNLCMCVAREAAAEVLAAVRQHPHGRPAQIVGVVRERAGRAGIAGAVMVVGADGAETVVELLYGAELPRLC
jgi:hydrogenase expression/formation protein HypE